MTKRLKNSHRADSASRRTSSKKATGSREETEFCFVAKAQCGHYIGAVSADPEDLETITRRTLKEWKADGLTVEQKPVSFVREGGLTFGCKCKFPLMQQQRINDDAGDEVMHD